MPRAQMLKAMNTREVDIEPSLAASVDHPCNGEMGVRGAREILRRERARWDLRTALFWQVVTAICIWGFIVGLHLNNDGLWYQGDAPRHAANGVFWSDFLRHVPASPRDFGFRYYARYPVINPITYPPVFYLLEAAAYRVFGLSPFVPKGLVLMTVLLGSLYMIAWLRRWVSEEAGWLGSLFILQPVIIIFGNAVMLNVPSTVLGVAALYHWRRYLEDLRSWHVYAAAAFAMLAVLTYVTVAIVVIVMLTWCLWEAGSRVALRQRRLWILAGATSIPIGAWFVLVMRVMPSNWNTLAFSKGVSTLWTLPSWSFYIQGLPQFVSIPTVILAAAGIALGLARPATRKETVSLALWLGIAYTWLTLLSQKEIPRYGVLLVPPIVLLAAIAVVNGLGLVASALGARAGRPRLLLWGGVLSATLALHVGLAAVTSVPRVSGFREIVHFVREIAPAERVFYDGNYSGVFSFYMRAGDPGFRSSVMLGQKLLYATKYQSSYGVIEIASTPAAVREAFRVRCGCRILVVERQIASGLAEHSPARASLRKVVQHAPARLLRSFRVEADAAEAGVVTDIDVYEWRDVEAVPSTVVLPFPALGDDVRYREEPIQR